MGEVLLNKDGFNELSTGLFLFSTLMFANTYILMKEIVTWKTDYTVSTIF